MKFKKYNSIENSYQLEFIESIINHGYSELEYVVQEKVHGNNLSFITDGNTIISAKRFGLIKQDEFFYNSNLVQDKYKDRILALYNDLSENFGAKTVNIFGELFGGGYPHPEISIDKTSKLVCRGIYYTPINDFYAFDILINNETYLDIDTTNKLFEKHNFIYAKTLFRGSLHECLKYPNEFKTTIPLMYSLPLLDGNICEGVVIKPIKPTYLRTGSRVLIKNKNERWSENNNYIDKNILSKLIHDSDEEISEEAVILCGKIYKHINQNRLDNLISKIGIVEKKDIGKLIGMYNKDVLTDFLKFHKHAYDKLNKNESKRINKFLNSQVSKLISTYFDNGK